ncbi:MAG: HPP family protein [Rhizobiales bacterium]|mgnify:CR=1 FL=1|nr:HPP family protein [Hyphomicrobiales bacterium]
MRKILVAAVGGGLGILVMILLGHEVGLELALVPFTTSIVLVMSAPETPFAKPLNIFGGHVISALCGLLVVKLCGQNAWFAALAVGLAIAAMLATDTMHPPAGINALLMVVAHPPWTFVLMPVASGALILVAFSWAYQKAAKAVAGG